LVVSKPAIVAVDDDPAVAAAITRDLRGRYSDNYRVVRATSGREALAVLASLALRDQPVALIITDQRMPQMTGIEQANPDHTSEVRVVGHRWSHRSHAIKMSVYFVHRYLATV
jgi:response regulator RpfG family c-di-GMP phosphodiesterase